MIDRNDPEIQAYLNEELQRQAEQITERILFKEKAIDIEKMAAIYNIELSQLEEYVKNPGKYAVFELVSHGITGRVIMKTLGITKGELQRYLLSWYTSNAYKPKLQFSEPKDEDLEEAYLEAVGAKGCCDGKTDW